MSSVYNPEADAIAQIELLESNIRTINRTIEHAKSQEDKQVLNKQIKELQEQIVFLRQRLP